MDHPQSLVRFGQDHTGAFADSLDGKPLSLAGAHGKVILLNFWATWCGPCRAEIPDLIELQTKYKDRLQIIGLTVDDDDPDVVKKVVDQTGINYPVAIASPEVRMAYGGIVALPTSFVLDPEGRVVQKHEGPLRDPHVGAHRKAAKWTRRLLVAIAILAAAVVVMLIGWFLGQVELGGLPR